MSQTVTLLAMIVHLYRKRSILVLRPGEFHLLIPDLTLVRQLVLKGLPMGFQMMVTSLAAVTMMSMVNQYGVHTSAAYGAAAQLWTYVQMPAMALGAAVSSMAAQMPSSAPAMTLASSIVSASKAGRCASTSWVTAIASAA